MPEQYDIRRSKRKTLALEIDASARLIVRAPIKLAHKDIEAFIIQKRQWIRRSLKEMEKVKQHRERERFFAGDMVLYLGREYAIQFVDVRRTTLDDTTLLLPLAASKMPKKYIYLWYVRQARQYVAPRIRQLAELYDYGVAGIRITSAKTRWGSCSPDNNISISWRLIQAPPAVVDYVIIHELVHTVHKNHKTRFWQRVAKHCPAYKTHVQWLKENSQTLEI